MIGVIDTGIGNIPSICSALKKINSDFILCSSKLDLDRARKFILPGVGSYKTFYENIQKKNIFDEIKTRVKNETPILGICLGFHALFESSNEFGNYNGFKFINGKVTNIRSLNIQERIPHVGWNNCEIKKETTIFKNIDNNTNFYFTHSFTPINVKKSNIIGVVNYGKELVVAVHDHNIFGVQFHPEKSQKQGLHLIKNFVEAFNG
jgi:glutamine amidotransferase